MILSVIALAKIVSIPEGVSQLNLDIGGTIIETFTYKPKTYQGKRLIMVMHGTLRNADEYRDHAKEMADRFGALIVVPKFDKERFPSIKYQRGGILQPDGKTAPASEWTYAFVPKIAAEIKKIESRPKLPLYIIGHSAGGQFVIRMAGFMKTGAVRLVAANPGSDLFPTREKPFGYGFGNLPPELSNDKMIKNYLAQPLTIYLGTADSIPDDDLDVTPEANSQGKGRYQRGLACFAFGEATAKSHGWKFGWKLVTAPEIKHDHEAMFNHPACELALFGKS